MTHVDYLIAGQGIAGTLLSYELLKAGYKVIVADRPPTAKASLVAGTVINPLSGKQYSPAQHAGSFIPAALHTYRSLETLLGADLLLERKLYIFPEDEDQAYVFEQARKKEQGGQLYWMPSRDYAQWGACFVARQGIGVQEPVWQVDAAKLLDLWRAYLGGQDAYRAEAVAQDFIELSASGIRYKDIAAKAIIFCEGAAAAQNPLWRSLPFTRNRGDVLLLDIPGLPATGIYHRGLRLVPRTDGLFWCGSNYQWNFEDLTPDAAWRSAAEAQLRQWLKLPFSVKEHIVAERPTTAGQLPLIGLHPHMPQLALFNGLGTRGFSSGPYWAAALSRLLTEPGYKIPGYDKAWFERQFR